MDAEFQYSNYYEYHKSNPKVRRLKDRKMRSCCKAQSKFIVAPPRNHNPIKSDIRHSPSDIFILFASIKKLWPPIGEPQPI